MKLRSVLAFLVLIAPAAMAEPPTNASLVGLHGLAGANYHGYLGSLVFDGQGGVSGTRKTFLATTERFPVDHVVQTGTGTYSVDESGQGVMTMTWTPTLTTDPSGFYTVTPVETWHFVLMGTGFEYRGSGSWYETGPDFGGDGTQETFHLAIGGTVERIGSPCPAQPALSPAFRRTQQ